MTAPDETMMVRRIEHPQMQWYSVTGWKVVYGVRADWEHVDSKGFPYAGNPLEPFDPAIHNPNVALREHFSAWFE